MVLQPSAATVTNTSSVTFCVLFHGLVISCVIDTCTVTVAAAGYVEQEFFWLWIWPSLS